MKLDPSHLEPMRNLQYSLKSPDAAVSWMELMRNFTGTVELCYSALAIKANRAIAHIVESPNFLCLILLLQNSTNKAPVYKANRAIAHQSLVTCTQH